MRRRTLLRAGALALAPVVASGHTPYRQWKVYRRRHLLIGTSRADAPTFPIGKAIAALLAEHLPQSRARAARAPDPYRLASLASTDQIQVLLLSPGDVRAMLDGEGEFAPLGPIALRTLYRFGAHVLVARADFPDDHARLVVDALAGSAGTIAGARAPDADTAPAPIHSGARAAIATR